MYKSKIILILISYNNYIVIHFKFKYLIYVWVKDNVNSNFIQHLHYSTNFTHVNCKLDKNYKTSVQFFISLSVKVHKLPTPWSLIMSFWHLICHNMCGFFPFLFFFLHYDFLSFIIYYILFIFKKRLSIKHIFHHSLTFFF